MQAPVKLTLEGIAIFPDGGRRPFSLAISEPFPHPEFDWQCEIVCPVFREKPMPAYGHEKEFAWCQALGFVQLMVKHMELKLETDDGAPLNLREPDFEAWGVKFPPSEHY